MKNLGEYYPQNDYFLYTPKIENSPETNFFLDKSGFTTRLPSSKLNPLWRSYGIVDQLKNDTIQLYHGLSHEIPLNIQKTKIKSVVTIHDLIFKHYPDTYPAVDRKIYDLKFKDSCQRADRIIAISNSTKEDIIQYYNIDPEKIDVVYQSCNPLYFKTDKAENNEKVLKDYNIPSEYLLYVGGIEKRKNLKTLINAFQALPADLRIPLVVVGRGRKYKTEAIQLVNDYGLNDLVIWVDNLSDNEHLKIVYQNAIAMIYPSVYEGFGLPVAEAMLSKIPVITSNVSSMPEAGGPDSMLIDPTNSTELADAIARIIDDSALRKIMIERGYEYAVKHFSPKITAKGVMDVYEKIIDA